MCRTSFPSGLGVMSLKWLRDDPVVGVALLGYGSQLEAGPRPGGGGLVSTQGQQSQEAGGSHPGKSVPTGFRRLSGV